MSSINTTADCDGVPAAVTDDILSSRRRCHLVTALAAAGGDAIVEDLAAAVFAAEEGAGPTETDSQAHETVARELYENHLPKLTATGLAEYDSMLGRIRLTEPALAKLAQQKLSE